MRRASVMLAAAGLAVPTAGLAVMPINMADYDCTRSDDGRIAPGDQLLKEGFEIASQGRFGETPNIMLMNPKTKTRANCFVRQGGAK